MPSDLNTSRFTPAEQQHLLDTARKSIREGLLHRAALKIDIDQQPAVFRESGACFVTIEKANKLRGCVGTLEARRPLIVDVAENAFMAAFQDNRFSPLSDEEYPAIDLHISVLTPAEPFGVPGEQQLLAALRPGVDGLILEEGGKSATFLPSVWKTLPNPRDFLNHLKQKGGWKENYWSDNMKVYRYTAELIPSRKC